MSRKYKHGDRVPTEVLVERIRELVRVITKRNSNDELLREFTMRIPAELDRDADLVLSEAARRLTEPEMTLGLACAYFRVKRQGKWESIELEYLTDDERAMLLADREAGYLLSCISTLSNKVRECEQIARKVRYIGQEQWMGVERTSC